MNIQLFLEGQEVELTNEISFPLNKSYENLYNPTDILIEYSKSINIPITTKNNKILGHAYRLDKSVYTGDGANIGLYLNPLKRIPFVLLYNGGILIEGYAKFVSANKSATNSYYTVNLIGKLGDIFHELKSVVTSESKLGDLNRNYLITKEDCVGNTSDEYFSANFAKESFEYDYPKIWNHLNNDAVDYRYYDVFGLAPAHRGLYSNFDSKKIQTDSTTIMELSEYLTNKWTAKNPNYNVTGASDIVGDGFKDYQMKEFRAYQLKPYMYFNHLMKIFVNKCKTLTGYTIELDKDWFNFNNPYWSKLCYMFDYLDNINPTVQAGVAKFLAEGESTDGLQDYFISGKTCSLTQDPVTIYKSNGNSDGYVIAPFDINFGCTVTPDSPLTNGRYIINTLTLMPDTVYKFDIDIYAYTNASGTKSRVGTYKFWTAKSSDVNTDDPNYNKDNYLELKGGGAGGGIIMSTRVWVESAVIRHNVTIPQIPVSGDFQYGIEVTVTVTLENHVGQSDNASTSAYGLYLWNTVWNNGSINVPSNETIGPDDTADYRPAWSNKTATFYFSVADLYSIENWKTNTPLSLETIWQKDTPLFDVILEYTKMFGLHWDVDYTNKKINLMTRNNIFKNYTVECWDDKVDKSKDFIIEPITFSDRYAVFNYKDTEGYIFSNYKNKFGVNIGEKRLNTGYEFNTTEKDLFKDINPTSVSSKSYVSMNQLIDWDARSILTPQIEPYVLLDYESEDEKNSISLNNWCFRGNNIVLDELMYITNDSPLMLTNNTSCYCSKEFILTIIGDGKGQDADVYDTYRMPLFTNACNFKEDTLLLDKSNTMGMMFNRPSEDYTYNQSVMAVGDNDLYNQFWRNYINERYNAQNKKLTAYITLTLKDFNEFKFNKLVTIDNQLFMVNKIIDFNGGNNGSTKVELIQLQNPSNLSGVTFRDRAITASYTSSSIIVTAYGYPLYDNVTYTGNIEQYMTGMSQLDSSDYSCYISLYFDDGYEGVSGDVIMTNSLGEELKITINK